MKISTPSVSTMGLSNLLPNLGDTVTESDLVARIWPVDRTGVPPVEYKVRRSGILAGRHFPGLVKVGDCVAMIAIEGN